MNRGELALGHDPVRDGADAYAQALGSAGGKELESLMHQGGRSGVCASIYASPPYDLRVRSLPISRLAVNLTRARVNGGVEGERGRSYETMRYSMFLVPAGVPVFWRKESPSRHLNIYFHPDMLDCAFDGAHALDKERPLFNAQMVGIQPLVRELAAELDSQSPLQAEAADSLARLLLVRLVRHLLAAGTAANPLTPKIVARLRDLVLGHLSERILVVDLASEAGLSPNRFALAFSELTGQSPHQFVLSLRLSRAAQLLRESSLSLAEVAHDCGFSHQQHLCNAMRRHFGSTPGLYRRLNKQATA